MLLRNSWCAGCACCCHHVVRILQNAPSHQSEDDTHHVLFFCHISHLIPREPRFIYRCSDLRMRIGHLVPREIVLCRRDALHSPPTLATCSCVLQKAGQRDSEVDSVARRSDAIKLWSPSTASVRFGRDDSGPLQSPKFASSQGAFGQAFSLKVNEEICVNIYIEISDHEQVIESVEIYVRSIDDRQEIHQCQVKNLVFNSPSQRLGGTF